MYGLCLHWSVETRGCLALLPGGQTLAPVSQAGGGSRRGCSGKEETLPDPSLTAGGFGVAQLSRIIPAFWEVSTIPICSKHKKPCGRLTDRDGLWEKKGTGLRVVQRKVTGPLPRQPLAAGQASAGALGRGGTSSGGCPQCPWGCQEAALTEQGFVAAFPSLGSYFLAACVMSGLLHE